MSTIPSQLSSAPAAAFVPAAKTSGHAHTRAARGAQAPADDGANAGVPVDPAATGLDNALARIQGQNQASALASLRDLEEAMAATRSAQQLIQTQSAAARAAHAGVTSAAALRVLEG